MKVIAALQNKESAVVERLAAQTADIEAEHPTDRNSVNSESIVVLALTGHGNVDVVS